MVKDLVLVLDEQNHGADCLIPRAGGQVPISSIWWTELTLWSLRKTISLLRLSLHSVTSSWVQNWGPGDCSQAVRTTKGNWWL